jgi:hypothetical protein
MALRAMSDLRPPVVSVPDMAPPGERVAWSRDYTASR